MSHVFRLKLAVAWEEHRVAVLLLSVGLVMTGSYIAPVARVEALLAVFLAAPLAAGLAVRSLWLERGRLRAAAFGIALLAAVAAELAVAGAIYGSPVPPNGVQAALLAALASAAILQHQCAREGVHTFFALGVGFAVALGLYAPGHVRAASFGASVMGALAVAALAGGGLGLGVVALTDRIASRLRSQRAS